MDGFNYIDMVLGVLLLWGIINGFRRGFIVEVASLLALVLGVWGGIRWSHGVADFVRLQWGWEGAYIPQVSFAITFVGIVIVVWLVGKLLTQVLKMIALNIFNRIAGGAFGLMKFAILLGVLIQLWNTIDPKGHIWPREDRNNSLLYPYVESLSTTLFPQLQELIPELWAPENPTEKKV